MLQQENIKTIDVKNRPKLRQLLLAKRKSIESGRDDWEAWAANVIHATNQRQENIFHLLAKDAQMTKANSIIGQCDLTLYDITEQLIQQAALTHSSQSAAKKGSGGAATGTNRKNSQNAPLGTGSGGSHQLSVQQVVRACKGYMMQQDAGQGQTPLHHAFKNGNIELVLCIFGVVKHKMGADAAGATNVINEMLNVVDACGMRPLDQLAFKIDDDHKNFIKEYHGEEKNFKISKQYELYSWGRADGYNLGYPQLSDERVLPKKVLFPASKYQLQGKSNSNVENKYNDEESIKDVRMAEGHCLALSEEGEVYSWGHALNGRLGLGDVITQIEPKKMKIDLKDENKKINEVKNKHKQFNGIEELIHFHRFVSTSSKKNDPLLSQKKQQVESDILSHVFNMETSVDGVEYARVMKVQGADDGFTETEYKRGKKSKILKQTLDTASKIINQKDSANQKFFDLQLQLVKLDKAVVTRIACSDHHSLITINTGSVYSWGHNMYGQLGYKTEQKSQSQAAFSAKPRKVEGLGKNFIIDAACGDSHSLVLTNDRQLYVWGRNHMNQLGYDKEMHPLIAAPRKFVLHEYMNSSNVEVFAQIQAKGDYTVLSTVSKNLYVSSPSQSSSINTTGGFLPLFGKSPGNFHYKKLDGSQVFLSRDYLLTMDSIKSIYRFEIEKKEIQQQKHLQDKRIANEIFNNSNFIELHPTDKDIWAVNTMRQLFVCRDFKSNLSKASLQFEPVNLIHNVMKAVISNKQRLIIKMVKKLDQDLMIKQIPETFKESTSLSDLCVSQLSKTICLWNCLDLLVFADQHLIEDLKINCLKFICLNLVSFFSEGTKLSEKLIFLPLYLIKDIENFLKEKMSVKFLHEDMDYFDMQIDYGTANFAVPSQSESYLHGNKTSHIQNAKLTAATCQDAYCAIQDMFEEYVQGNREDEQLKRRIAGDSHRFRQALKRHFKKFKRKLSFGSVGGGNEDDGENEAMEKFLEMINEFMDNSIGDEMAHYYLQRQAENPQGNVRERFDSNVSESVVMDQQIQQNDDSEIEEQDDDNEEEEGELESARNGTTESPVSNPNHDSTDPSPESAERPSDLRNRNEEDPSLDQIAENTRLRGKKIRKKQRKQVIQLQQLVEQQERIKEKIEEKTNYANFIKEQFDTFFLPPNPEDTAFAKQKSRNDQEVQQFNIEKELCKKADEIDSGFEIVKEKKRWDRPQFEQSVEEKPEDDGSELGIFRKGKLRIANPEEKLESAAQLASWNFQDLSQSAKTQDDKQKQGQSQLNFEQILDEENEYLQRQKRRQKKLQQLQSDPEKNEQILNKIKQKSAQNHKKEQRKANEMGNQSWAPKLHQDEEIDFEELIKEEAEMQREQQKRDAELARKLLEDELARQEQEQIMLAIKYSMIEEKNRNKAGRQQQSSTSDLTTYSPYNETKVKEQLAQGQKKGGGANGGGKRRRGKGAAWKGATDGEKDGKEAKNAPNDQKSARNDAKNSANASKNMKKMASFKEKNTDGKATERNSIWRVKQA